MAFIHFIFYLFLFSQCLYAFNIQCPSVSEIKKHQFNWWMPLYIENEEQAMPRDIEHFKKHVTKLASAKWSPRFLESAHCYYQGDDLFVEKILFAQDSYRPLPGEKWQWILENKLAECKSDIPEECVYIA